ncbi:hypothetical protein [Pantoea dispersa]|uniref:hypothetical protein n=1 Tax=Pantoea dispersa TaxID=59814 RepID=UPI00201348FC|nr:hypothetical protein [Pantoea dispersa]
MSLEEFKRRLRGFRTAKIKDFDEYLFNWLRIGVEEAQRPSELGRMHGQITGQSLSPLMTAREAKGCADHYTGNMYSDNDMTARSMLVSTVWHDILDERVVSEVVSGGV